MRRDANYEDKSLRDHMRARAALHPHEEAALEPFQRQQRLTDVICSGVFVAIFTMSRVLFALLGDLLK